MERDNSSIQFYVRKTKKDLIEIVEHYEIDKIRMGFRCYDQSAEPGARTTNKVDFYMPIGEFELLCHNLLSGNILARLNKGKEIPTVYKGSERDGKVYSRTLQLTKSNRGMFLTATEGPGKKDGNGAVQPLYKLNEAPARVSVSLDPEEVKAFALQGRRACDVYYARMAAQPLQEKLASMQEEMGTIKDGMRHLYAMIRSGSGGASA